LTSCWAGSQAGSAGWISDGGPGRSCAACCGIPAGWVTGDEVYGAGPGLRAEFEDSGIGYVLAVAVAGRRWTIEERFQTGQRTGRPGSARVTI
jgi:hypothetical protein